MALVLLTACVGSGGAVLAQPSGSLSIAEVRPDAIDLGRYERLELSVDIRGLQIDNPYDPDQVDVSATFRSPSDETWHPWGFYDGAGWKVRFAPNETGTWEYSVRVESHGQTASSGVGTFQVDEGEGNGWLRVSTVDPHYLVHDDGTPFFGVGQAGAKGDPDSVEDLTKAMAAMKRHGLNVMQVWLGGNFPLESEGRGTRNSGLGRYDQEQARRIDALVEAAEHNGIVLIPVIWVHNQFYNKWSTTWDDPGGRRRNPYHRLGGGNLSPGRWTVDPASLEYQRRLLRYVIARWSYSPAIGVWGLFAEINLARFEEQDAWVERTRQWLREHDPFGHPTTASLSNGKYWAAGYEVLDIAAFHDYRGQPRIRDRTRRIVDAIRYMRRWRKPNLIGEFGVEEPANRLAFVRDAYWATALSGSAMTPLYWWLAGDRFSDPPGSMSWSRYLEMQARLSEFVSTIPFGTTPLRPAKPGEDVLLESAPGTGAAPGQVEVFSQRIVPSVGWKPGRQLERPLSIVGPGRILGDARALSTYLHGRHHADLRQPVDFVVKGGPSAALKINVEAHSTTGGRIVVETQHDRVLDARFRQSRRSGRDYSREVSKVFRIALGSGVHHISVLNPGRDWVRVSEYTFSGLSPMTGRELDRAKMRARGNFYGLRGANQLYAYLPARGEWGGGKLRIKELEPGRYQARCWSAATGRRLALAAQSMTTGGELAAALPDTSDPMACRVVPAD